MAFLRAFGSYLPTRVVTNDELAPLLEVESAWITQVSGIETRRYAAEDQSIADLALLAAQDCLQRAGVLPTDLGMILVASGSPDCYCPGPAATVATMLGLNSTPALDIPVASAGSLIALATATQFAHAVGKVLVIGAEIMSRRIQLTPDGKNTAILFGDGAGAALVDPENGFARIAGHTLHTDGSHSEALYIANNHLHMEGGSIILQATRKIPRAIQDLLAKHQLAPETIGTVLMHQANLNLITAIARALKLPTDRFFANIQNYGNTSSASMLIAAAEWRQQNPGTLTTSILFAAFGTGLNWGALLALPS